MKKTPAYSTTTNLRAFRVSLIYSINLEYLKSKFSFSTMSDQDIQELESQFPAVSGQAFAAARQQALDAGLSVLESRDGVIYEVSPDGQRKAVKQIEPLTFVEAGTKIEIR